MAMFQMIIYDNGAIFYVRRDGCELFDNNVDDGGVLRTIDFNFKIMIRMNAMIN